MGHSHTSSTPRVHIIGAGMAGSEAAHYLARSGIKVILHEMRPKKMTEAHQTGGCAELVCSNSFKSNQRLSPPWILKSEMKILGSLLLEIAEKTSVPAGEALAVERLRFSELVTERLRNHPLIEFSGNEISEPFSEPTLIATGPLTSGPLSQWIQKATDSDGLYFYDAIAPIVDASSVDMNHAYLGNRYGKGEEEAYLNCPLDEREYYTFVDTLTAADQVPSKSFEKMVFFQGCQPIEAIAAGGRDSLRFGPMRPVGLNHPVTGKRPFAVLQLRPENRARTAYNMVGFQTKLKYGEQKKVFGLIPALKNAEFLRLGSIHRNTFVCGPKVLFPDLSLKRHSHVYLAGQISGVEGYLESAAIGLLCAEFIRQRIAGESHRCPPPNTALGSLLRHVVASNPDRYQPMNINFGMIDPIWFDLPDAVKPATIKKDQLRTQVAEQCVSNFSSWAAAIPLLKPSEVRFNLSL